MTNDRQTQFIAAFNAELDKLDCGARVEEIPDNAREMDIVTLDGGSIGRIPCGIGPEAFAAFMLIVEQQFEEAIATVRGALNRAMTGGTAH
jgi:hypothetical protein